MENIMDFVILYDYVGVSKKNGIIVYNNVLLK